MEDNFSMDEGMDRRWNSGGNVREASLACPPLISCYVPFVPNRPWTGTSPGPEGWGP